MEEEGIMTEVTEGLAAETGSRWDPLVRITHWGVAVAVLLNGLVTTEGGQVHIWIGYTALALLALRLIWGFVGTEEARFTSFAPSLSAARAHVSDLIAGRHPAHRSHNPLGALMAYALWGTLLVVSVTGIAMAGSPFTPRPAGGEATIDGDAGRVEDGEYAERGGQDDEGEEGGGEEALEEIHEVAANLLLVLAALHVGGVALESRLSGRNLAREMVTGKRGGQLR
jgi:cytochrome b